MTSGARSDAVYLHSEDERQRLIALAKLYEPYTRALFLDAGLEPGMRVLDVGCGVGDVSLLAASFVGQSGQVVGVDIEPRAVQLARIRAEQAGTAQVRFIQGDLRELSFEREYDAVVGRFVLMLLADPAEALGRLTVAVRPGGIIAFQEYQFEYTPLCTAPIQLWDEWMRLFLATARRQGLDTSMGMHLYQTFVAAGLPAPQIQMDVHLVHPGDVLAPMAAEQTLRSLLPLMEKFGIATAEQVDVDTFARRYAGEVSAKGAVQMAPPVVRAWTHVP